VQGDDRHEHATPKPVDMMERVIKSSAPNGGIVLTPFAGTWPEVIAAERTGRRVRGIETSEQWCAVALDRFQQTFSVTPRRIPKGHTIATASEARHAA
jgi:site-specific DNA-methyltransferase (adenine-specific)